MCIIRRQQNSNSQTKQDLQHTYLWRQLDENSSKNTIECLSGGDKKRETQKVSPNYEGG